MIRRRTLAVVLLGGLGLAAALWLWPSARAPVAPGVTPRSRPAPVTPAPVTPPEERPGAAAVSPPGPSGAPDAVLETRRPLRIEAALAPEPVSAVPHRLRGAWDEAPDGNAPGAHRTFVLLVDPALATSALETLVRDVAARHRDAEILDVRVYDSEAALTASGADAGAARAQHLVAEVKRNDRLGYRVLRVRGVALDP